MRFLVLMMAVASIAPAQFPLRADAAIAPIGVIDEQSAVVIDDAHRSEPNGVELGDVTRENALAALDVLERGIFKSADLASVNALSPKLEEALGREPRLMWMQAISFAATGETQKAASVAIEAAALAEKTDTALALVAEAMIARNRGDAQAARSRLERVLRGDRQNAFALNVLGSLFMNSGKSDQAIEFYQRAAIEGVNTPVFRANLGAALVAQERLAEAANALNDALAVDASYCPALINLGLVSFQTGRFDEAASLADRCINNSFSEAQQQRQAALLSVRSLASAGAFERAIAFVDKNDTLIEDPTAIKAELYLRLGDGKNALATIAAADLEDALREPYGAQRAIALALTGDIVSALSAAKAAVEAGGNTSTVVVASGLAAAHGAVAAAPMPENATDVEAAIARVFAVLDGRAAEEKEIGNRFYADLGLAKAGLSFDQLSVSAARDLAASPQRSEFALGIVYLARGLWRPAAAQFSGFDAGGAGVIAQYLAGVSALEAGDKKAGAGYLAKAASGAAAYGGLFAAQAMLGDLSMGAGDMARASTRFQNAVRIREDAPTYLKLGAVAELAGEDDVAVSAYRNFIRLQPESFLGYNQLAWHYAERGENLDTALENAAKAYALAPENASVLDTFGWLKFRTNDLYGALPLLEKANDIANSRNADIVLHLAEAWKASDKMDDALRLLERARKNIEFTAAQETRIRDIVE